MPSKPKPVHDLKTYWKREKRFAKRQGLINGRTMLSLDAPRSIHAQTLKRTRSHSPEWEIWRIEKAIASLPKSLKRYKQVLWAIYYHLGDLPAIIAASGLKKSQYFAVRKKLLKFFLPNVSAPQTPIELLPESYITGQNT